MKTRRSRKAARENLELVTLAQRFEIHNRSEGKVPRTVRWYNQTVEVFTGWLESEGMSTRLDDVGEDEARLFILHLQERRGLWGKASSHTVNNRVRALRAFFNWLYRQGYTESHKLEHVKPPKVRKMVNLKYEDVYLGSRYVKVLGKVMTRKTSTTAGTGNGARPELVGLT